ncbi:MAG: 50S ribosomal protein L6 [Actinomycetota bacterium]|jgi:large subunit ribosomal protein L6|nr:50S ribosomal protein L6 [Actinomycetota bacterium]
MSRIGKVPVEIPGGVSVQIDNGNFLKVSGPKGSLERTLPGEISIRQDASVLVVERPNDERLSKALHGLSRTLVSNMVNGVASGFSKELEIVGVGYRAILKSPTEIEMALGFSHPVKVVAPEGIAFEVPIPTRIIVRGIDKELVGQVAANIRKIRKPEPYKGKGVRYSGEKILRKAGKTGK